MSSLSNDMLIEAYIKAKKLKLPADFVALINKELQRRGLKVCSRVNSMIKMSVL